MTGLMIKNWKWNGWILQRSCLIWRLRNGCGPCGILETCALSSVITSVFWTWLTCCRWPLREVLWDGDRGVSSITIQFDYILRQTAFGPLLEHTSLQRFLQGPLVFTFDKPLGFFGGLRLLNMGTVARVYWHSGREEQGSCFVKEMPHLLRKPKNASGGNFGINQFWDCLEEGPYFSF